MFLFFFNFLNRVFFFFLDIFKKEDRESDKYYKKSNRKIKVKLYSNFNIVFLYQCLENIFISDFLICQNKKNIYFLFTTF